MSSDRAIAAPNGNLLGRVIAWFRRQSAIRCLYRTLPISLRRKVSASLNERNAAKVRFSATEGWRRALEAADAVAITARQVNYVAGAGVNVFGYFRGQFGLGESARMYARALLESGYPTVLVDVPIDLPHGMEDRSLDRYLSQEAPHAVCMIFVNPDFLPQALEAIGRAKIEGKYIIACWFWELETVPPEWLPSINLVDEIMVSSLYVRNAFVRATSKPVFCVPLPLSRIVDSGLTRADFGLPDDKYLFLSSFDFNSWIARKNPAATVEAFRMAFEPGRDDVMLLLKTSNGYRNPAKLAQLLEIAGGDPRILVRDDIIDRAHMQALQRCADAYVSLHRAEGFGLGMAECMAIGKPVIGTNWSGNIDFMSSQNSCLVDYELVPVQEGEYAHHHGQRWAEANRKTAAVFMLRLVDDPAFGSALARRASADIAEALAPDKAAGAIINRLRQCHGTGAGMA